MTLAELAYEAYRAHTGGISLASGQPIPEWSALKPEIQDAWKASTDLVSIALDCDAVSSTVGEQYIDRFLGEQYSGLSSEQSKLVNKYLETA